MTKENEIIKARRVQLLAIGVLYDPVLDGYYTLPKEVEKVKIPTGAIFVKDEEEWEKALKSVKKELKIKQTQIEEEEREWLALRYNLTSN